jgi:dolichol-phosphate mannosyltransferase
VLYIVLPAFNEGDNVAVLLTDICRVLHELLPNTEVATVLVDDGSSDNTRELAQNVARSLAEQYPVHKFRLELLAHPENKGLAEAIKTGLFFCCDQAEDRDIIVTMDCDNSHTPGLVPRLARAIFEGHDVVVASRFQRGAQVVGLSWQRQLLSYAASGLLRMLFPIKGIRDYTCGFRAYRAEVLKKIIKANPGLISEKGFSVMVDLLLKIHHYDPDLAFGEIPLLLRYDRKMGSSKMNIGKTVRQTLSLIWRRKTSSWTN